MEVEESLQAALESLTKAEERIRALKLEFEQAKIAAYEAESKEAQDKMNLQLPRVCNEFYTDSWHAAVGISNSGLTPLTLEPPFLPFPGACPPLPPEASTDVVDLEDAQVTSVQVAEELASAGQPPDASAPTFKGGNTASDLANL